jgi:hypothetical protein
MSHHADSASHQPFICAQKITDYIPLKSLATSMLVTDIGDQIFWWQASDNLTIFGCHQHRCSRNIQEIALKTWAEWQRYVGWCDGLKMLVTGLLFWWLFGLRPDPFSPRIIHVEFSFVSKHFRSLRIRLKISNLGWKSQKFRNTSDIVSDQ